MSKYDIDIKVQPLVSPIFWLQVVKKSWDKILRENPVYFEILNIRYQNYRAQLSTYASSEVEVMSLASNVIL